MKICIDTQTLSGLPTGLYRYTSNLYTNYLKQYPNHELCAICFKEGDLIPHEPILYAGLFKSELVGKYKFERNWPLNGRKIIIDRLKQEYSYKFYSAQLQKARMESRPSSEINKIKIKREISRISSQMNQSIRTLAYGKSTPILCDEETKVIHSPYHAFPHELLLKYPRILTAQTVHDLIPLKFSKIFSDAAIKDFRRVVASALKCDLIFVPSEATKRDLLSCEGFNLKNIVVTPLAADNVFAPAPPPEIECVRSKVGIPENREYFLSVSTLEPRKNFPFLLRAFSKLIAQTDGRKPMLVLTGKVGWGGDTQREIVQLLEQMREHVIYTGYLTDEELRALYSGALAFLMPSIYEGFGLPLLESMACGTPVISSNTSSMPEVVGDAGILIPPQDEDLWVSSMLLMLNFNKSQYCDMAVKAHERSRLFSWERTAKLTEQAYRHNLREQKI